MAVIAIDFDGVLVNGDKAINGAREAINIMREQGHKVIINSCNNLTWIERVLNNNDIRFDKIYGKDRLDTYKVVADIYIDDKGYHFMGDWEKEVPLILDFVKGKDNRKW